MDYLSEVIKAAVWGESPPQMPKWNKWLHRSLSDNHCEECLKLDGCWLTKNKTPEWPHHPYCHCVLENIPYNEVINNATATAAYSKFDPYLIQWVNMVTGKNGYLKLGDIRLMIRNI